MEFNTQICSNFIYLRPVPEASVGPRLPLPPRTKGLPAPREGPIPLSATKGFSFSGRPGRALGPPPICRSCSSICSRSIRSWSTSWTRPNKYEECTITWLSLWYLVSLINNCCFVMSTNVLCEEKLFDHVKDNYMFTFSEENCVYWNRTHTNKCTKPHMLWSQSQTQVSLVYGGQIKGNLLKKEV